MTALATARRRWTGAALALAPLLAPAPSYAAAPPAPDAPLDVAIKTDASAPQGVPKANAQVVVQPRLAPELDAKISVTFAAGARGDDVQPWAGVTSFQPFAWTRAGVALHAGYALGENAKVQLDASDELKSQSYIGPTAINSRPQSLDEAQGAALKASAPLAPGMDLTLSAGVGADIGAVDLVENGSVLRRVALRDEHGDVSSKLAWTLTPRLRVELGETLASRSLAWGEAGLVDGYAAAEPKAVAVLKPLDGVEATVTVEQAMSPLQTAKFAALAQAAETAAIPAAGSRLRPDEAWQVKAALVRKFAGSGALALTYTDADLKSSTELVQIAPGVQAPGSVTGGERRQWDMSLNLPLKVIGLEALSLQGSGLMRWSEIGDPITGELRPLSGETPYEAKLGLVAELKEPRLSLGLQSRASGPQTVYSLTRVDEVEISPSLGAFVEYKPADLALRLQLDDLVGADRRYQSTLYGASRDQPPVGETDRRVTGGPGFTLSLRKAL